MVQQITGHEYPIKEIFSNKFQFTIPPYQRPYAWTTEQAGEMLDDFIDFMEQDGAGVDREPYFLGSVVLIKQENDPAAQVIDGQQRLTTLTILLAAIASKVDQKDRGHVMQYINEPGNPIEDLEPKPRLTLRERDRDFFRRYVQEPGNLTKLANTNPDTDPGKNIRANAEFYLKRLNELIPERIFELGKFVANRCYLVAVCTPNLTSAYRIFSVMNDRGLDLLPSDILKADIIGELAPESCDDYNEKWEEVEDALGRDGLNELLGHVRSIYRRVKQKTTLLEEIRSHVLEKVGPAQFIDDVLVPYGDAFSHLRLAGYEGASDSSEINEQLQWLLRIDNRDWMVPAIYYFANDKYGEENKLRFSRRLERLASSLFIRRCNVNERIDRYAKVLDAIDNGNDLFADASPLMLSEKEREDTATALDGDIYENSRTRTYVLLRLDSWLAGEGATYDHKIITVEHVLPQTVKDGSGWAREWPDAVVREQWVHKLGNLVLLSRRINSSAQNYDFDVKKRKYFATRNGTSPFALTTGVLQADVWTPAVVEDRQRRLIERFKQGWDL